MSIYRALEARRSQKQVEEWQRRVLRSVALLMLALACCMTGLFLLDPSADAASRKAFRALWNAVNLLSTLGDFTSFNDRQRGFLIATMLLFGFIGGYAVTNLYGLLSGNAFALHKENQFMKRLLGQLGNHVVVVGYGVLGQIVAGKLRDSGKQVLILENSETLISNASEHGYLAVHGDAGVDEETLFGHARLKHACALVITTEEADRALTITLMAHTYNPQLAITVVAANNQRAGLLHRAGATEVVIADALVAAALVERVTNPPTPALAHSGEVA